MTDGPERRRGGYSTEQDLNACECVSQMFTINLSGCASVVECVRRLLSRGIETESFITW